MTLGSRWMWWSIPCLLLFMHVSSGGEVNTEHACFGEFLELNCATKGEDTGSECEEEVIAIIWNNTFFGESNCSSADHLDCCPGIGDCITPVENSEHWQELISNCSGKCVCRVQADRVNQTECLGDSGFTDYENITYECIIPRNFTPTAQPTSTSKPTSPFTASEVTTQSATGMSTPTARPTSTSKPASTSTASAVTTQSATDDNEEGNDGDESNTNIGVIVAVLAVLLIILLIVVVIYLFYRRRTKKSQPPPASDMAYRGSLKRAKTADDPEHAYSVISDSQQSQRAQNPYELDNEVCTAEEEEREGEVVTGSGQSPTLPPARTWSSARQNQTEPGYDLPENVSHTKADPGYDLSHDVTHNQPEPGYDLPENISHTQCEAGYDLPENVVKPKDGKSAENSDYSYAYGHFEAQGRHQSPGHLNSVTDKDKPPVAAKPGKGQNKPSVPAKPTRTSKAKDSGKVTSSSDENPAVPPKTCDLTDQETGEHEKLNAGEGDKEITYATIVSAGGEGSSGEEYSDGGTDPGEEEEGEDMVITDNDLYNM